MKLCECGCGEAAPVYNQSHTARGIVKGQPARFIQGHQLREHLRTRKAGNRYRGGKHVEVAERALGKPLPVGAEVHHVDGIKRNNDPRNLVICQDTAYHRLLHIRAEVLKAGGNPNLQRLCRKCGQCKAFAEFSVARRKQHSGRTNWCKACSSAAFKAWAARKKAEAA